MKRRTVHRVCTICEATCGLAVDVEGRRVLAIRGDADDPDRLRRPVEHTDSGFVEVSWEEAFELAAEDPRWRALFDELEEAGACTAEKRAFLVAWMSGDAEHAPEFGAIYIPRALLLKIVHEPGAPLRAKANLPLGPRLALG